MLGNYTRKSAAERYCAGRRSLRRFFLSYTVSKI